MNNFINNHKIVRISDPVAAGVDGAFVACTEIDMQGFENVAIVFAPGIIAANGVFTSRVKNSDTSATYGAGTIDRIGADLANNADTDDKRWVVHDIRRPKDRYVTAYYQRTVGNVTLDLAFAILYNGAPLPVTQTEVEASQTLNGPARSTV